MSRRFLTSRVLSLFVDMPPDDGLTIPDVRLLLDADGWGSVSRIQVTDCLCRLTRRGVLRRGEKGTPDEGLYLPAMPGEEAA